MSNNEEIKSSTSLISRYIWILTATWTVVIAVALWWNIFQVREYTMEEARIQARIAYVKDVIYRRWNAEHGGVYAPVTEKTLPNPYLSHLPERDITTPSGKLLTLINPAYMTRQSHELMDEAMGIRGHITSLNPIRPQNEPDSWETAALQAFEKGEPEVSSVEIMDGKEYMRLMRPLITEKTCLKCHADQGYRTGDIRGGISATVPMLPLWSVTHTYILMVSLAYVMVWLMGLLMLRAGGKRLIRSDRRVNERTADLKNEITERKRIEKNLIQAERLAIAAQIASESAHEIKNPLAVIKTGLYYLERILPENNEAQKTIFKMDEAVQRAVSYINDLLNFSKPPELQRNKVNINEMIKKAIDELSAEIFSNIDVKQELTSNLPDILADFDRLKQVVTNLVKNAAEAMRGGGSGKLKVKSEMEGDFIKFSISDTGRGIAEEDLKHIFDPFFTTKAKGTGLGLAICQRIIEAHKGEIEVKSAVGEGTVFVVKLPVTVHGCRF